MKRWQLSIFSQRVTKQESHCSGFWATVCKIVHPMRSDRCLSCLSVCEVGVLWQNGYMDQDETWDAGRPRPWPRCVRWGGACSPPPKGAELPNFRPMSIVAKRLDGSRCHVEGGRTQPKRHCIRWGSSSSSPKREQSPQFSAHVYCGQTAEWTKVPLGMEVGLGPGHIVLDGDPAPPPQ